jgi:hypothetical protein
VTSEKKRNSSPRIGCSNNDVGGVGDVDGNSNFEVDIN